MVTSLMLELYLTKLIEQICIGTQTFSKQVYTSGDRSTLKSLLNCKMECRNKKSFDTEKEGPSSK